MWHNPYICDMIHIHVPKSSILRVCTLKPQPPMSFGLMYMYLQEERCDWMYVGTHEEYTYIYSCTHMYMWLDTYRHMRRCDWMYIGIHEEYTHIYSCTHMYMWLDTYRHMRRCDSMYIGIHEEYTHIYSCTHMYMWLDTYRHMRRCDWMYIYVPKPSILRLCIPNPKPPTSSRWRKGHLHEEVWLEMYVYVPHTSAYTCTRAWLDVCLYVYMCIHLDGCISICINVYTYKWMYIYMCTCVYF